MPLKIQDHADLRKIRDQYQWRELLDAHRSGGDHAFDKKWLELYGETIPKQRAKTSRPPGK